MEFYILIKAIKYIHKYIFKSNNQITIPFQKENNEVTRHLNKQYINYTQTTYKLFKYQNHQKNLSII